MPRQALPKDIARFDLRLPKKLLTAIRKLATAEDRSANSEIVQAIKKHLR